jgi:hypothetical protein
VSPESQPGAADLFAERLTEALDAHVVRPRRASDTDVADAGGTAAALVAQLRAATTWSEPPADLRDTVLARVLGREAEPEPEPEDEEPDEPPLAAEAAPVTAPVTAPVAVLVPAGADEDVPAVEDGAGLAEVRELRPRWRRLTWAVPIAAAAAALFTVAVLGVQQALEPGAPVGTTFSAAGTSLAPDAEATVTVAKAAAGFSVVIDARGLPAAADGSYYIAWLRGPTGVVPIGSFHARAIAKPITLWSGVDPKLYPNFSVTLQREGAPPTPSGVTVLRGQLTQP